MSTLGDNDLDSIIERVMVFLSEVDGYADQGPVMELIERAKLLRDDAI